MAPSPWQIHRLLAMLCVCAVLAPLSLRAADDESPEKLEHAIVTFKDDRGTERTVDARILVEAQDGGMLLLGRDGRLWTVEPDKLLKREALDAEFKPYTPAELGERLQQELGPGFEVQTTEHYVLCSNAGKPYVKWCGRLFERLYTAFHDYWKKQGFELKEREFPLAAIIFADEIQFGEFATKDAGPDSATAKGYFSIPTNRMVLYDLTAAKGKRAGSEDEIERNLSAAPYNTATVVHEATHQIAFNSGMHKRFADNPLWLTEGMAMFFETPDLRSKTGWKTVGSLNRVRVKPWLDFVANRRTADSLRTLLGSDARFTDPETAGDAYAESWALTWYLIKNRDKDYTKYLQRLSQKPRLEWLTPEGRLKEFQAFFGNDLDALDRDFTRYMKRYARNQ